MSISARKSIGDKNWHLILNRLQLKAAFILLLAFMAFCGWDVLEANVLQKILWVLGLLALSACSSKLASLNSGATIKPLYHNVTECPAKSDLPKIGYIQDLMPANSGKGVILLLSDGSGAPLKILVDGKEHSESYLNGTKKDGSPDYQTLVYRAGCHDKSINARFFVGNKRGSWELDRGNGGYQFTNTFGGSTIDSKFYKKNS